MINDKNLGFAKANNQALAVCNGEYVLFLNPDTLVPEDCFQRCLSFIKAHPDTGAMGVRMLDGMGCFLPESKRSFPAPWVSFFKLTGLAALFPKSKIFNRYALGHLDDQKNHIVEVLAGAFLLVKKELLNKLNGFDENYFLYGEDIDLSFRIQQAGYKNAYFAETSIIHFKGESSADHPLSRVRFFYHAMLVFVQKHYLGTGGKLFSVLLQFAIACRAAVSAAKRILKPVLLPVIDGAMVWLSLQLIKMVWVTVVRNRKDFGVPFVPYALPAFSLLFVLMAAFVGLYDRKQKNATTILSVAFATLSILAAYSLLPETIRFSRGVIVWGGLLGGLLIFLLRQIFYTGTGETEDQTVIVAAQNEYTEISKLLEHAMLDHELLGRVSIVDSDSDALCTIHELSSLKKSIHINKIIFCAGALSLTEIIAQMQLLNKQHTKFLFHIAGSKSIVGSHTLESGAFIVSGFVDYRITHPYQKRMKRVVDMSLSLLLLIMTPVNLFIHPKPGALLLNIFPVFSGAKTWVGYASASTMLPEIKKGIVSQIGQGFNLALLEKTDRRYAKNYDWWQDIVIVFKNYRRLGNDPM